MSLLHSSRSQSEGVNSDLHIITVEDQSKNQATQEGRNRTGISPAEEQADTAIDIYYENQRGFFFCGIPLFSSAGLWFTDPDPWTNLEGRFTPFNICTATCPDPTWDWSWKKWYVDMSGDVDEDGWEYNIVFQRRNWHGHHVWFHSFVRRRRWLRKRRKKRFMQEGHLNPVEDYFTIYSSNYKSMSTHPQDQPDLDGDLDGRSPTHEEELRIENLPTLMTAMKSARLDREKLDAVEEFLEHSGQDLELLSGEMKNILRFMIFQESRRQLLSMLTRYVTECEQSDGPDSKSRQRFTINALDTANALIGRLEYWSDRQRVAGQEDDTTIDAVVSRILSAQKLSGAAKQTSDHEGHQETVETVDTLTSHQDLPTLERYTREQKGKSKSSGA